MLLSLFPAFAQEERQEPADSIVTLISSKSAQLLEINGQSYRKVVGPARFLHNNTYLLCDTALWNVDTRIIDAIGNVKIIQQETELQSEKMVYRIDLDLAEFRGDVVQLKDKDNNILRTRNLDYNTKDSVAVFRGGGSMKDKDGQIIESQTGVYDSKIKLFTFTDDVNMFTDSIFVKTSRLKYESDRSFATFGYGTDAWKEENMLSANAGWYDRTREIFFFRNNVHVMSETQEGWSDSLYFYRNTMDVDMLGNAQVSDTTRNVAGVAGKISYKDSLSEVTMTRTPAVIAVTEEDNVRDTVYFGADTLIYRTVKMCDIDSAVVETAASRIKSLDIDPVTEFRQKAAAEAAKKAEEEAKNDPNRRPQAPKAKPQTQPKAQPEVQPQAQLPEGGQSPVQNAGPVAAPGMSAGDQLSVQDSTGVLRDPLGQRDSLAVPDSLQKMSPVLDSLTVTDSLHLPDSLGGTDSLMVLADSIQVEDSVSQAELDTTKIGFVRALRNVRIYKRNMQIVCDSLEYSDLDSIARLYKQPVIWNEVTQQYSADSVYALIRGNIMEKVSLMSNAFVHMEKDTLHYDQIRGAEMMAYFDDQSQLTRFDALGGASAIFYMEENDALATANKKDSKMLSAVFRDNTIYKVYYFDTAKSDAYPVVQMTADDQRLKGFCWQPERRPEDRHAVTGFEPKAPERKYYASRPRARFTQTGLYFPGYIDDIYVQIETRDSLRRVRERDRQIAEREQQRYEQFLKDSIAVAKLDSIAVADSIALSDSLAMVADSVARADSLAMADSIRNAAIADSLASVVPTKEQLREQARKEREEKKAARKAAKEARWAEKDKADADREKAKEEKRQAKLRSRKLKLLMDAQAEAEKDARTLESYIEKYRKKEARKKERLERKAARKGQSPAVPAPEKDAATVSGTGQAS